MGCSPPTEEASAPGLRTVVSARQIRSQARSSLSAVRAVTWIVVLALAALLLTWWQGYLEWPGGGLPSSGETRSDTSVIVLPASETVSPAMQRDVAPLLQEEKVLVVPAGDRAGSPAAASPAAPVAPQVAAPAAAPVPPVVLELTGRSWVEVLDSTGAFKINGTFDRGFRKPFEGEPPYRVAISNYNAARLLVDGKAMDLLPHFNGRLVRLTLDPRESRPQ